MDSVTVLVGNSQSGAFSGFIARFKGEEVAAYYEGENNAITCTLYLCETYQGRHYYRVHEADETNTRAPRYELFPYKQDARQGGGRYPDYGTYLEARNILERWPMFAEHLGILTVRDI